MTPARQDPKSIRSTDLRHLYDRDYLLHGIAGHEVFDPDHFRFRLLPGPELALRLCPPRPHEVVLEVGFGRGEVLVYLASRGARVFGLDFSDEAHHVASGLLAKTPAWLRGSVSLVVGSATLLPFPDDFFDRVYAMEMVEHVNDEELEAMLYEVNRVLRIGGTFVFSTPDARAKHVAAQEALLREMAEQGTLFTREPRHSQLHIGYRGRRQYRRFLRRYGFRVRFHRAPSEYDTHLVCPVSLRAKIANWLKRHVSRADLVAVARKAARDLCYLGERDIPKIPV